MNNLDRFLELDKTGWSAAEIAHELRVSVRTVERWRSTHGRRKHDTATPFPPEARQRAAALIADGCSIAEAARTVGASTATVARWFPDAPRWSKQQSAQWAVFVRRNREMAA